MRKIVVALDGHRLRADHAVQLPHVAGRRRHRRGAPSTGTGTTGSSSGSGSAGSGSTSSGGGSSSSSAGGSATTVTGDTAQTRWGPVQVQITVAGGKITDVTPVQYPNGNGRDQEINSYALPVLAQEALAAQSADIDHVSGATVTSDGYVQSLQSAIDQANL